MPSEKALAKQEQYLARSKEEYERLSKLGYDIFQCDASVFSPDSFVPTAWAPKGQPPRVPHKWSSKPYIAVFAGISVRSGCLVQMYREGAAFKAVDIDDFLHRLRGRVGKHKKLAVFWDNASIHAKPGRETAPQLLSLIHI